MDPFNSTGLASNPGDTTALQASVSHMAPLAVSFHGPISPNPAYVAPAVASPSGVLPTIGHFLGAVGSTGYHIATAAGKWLGTQLVHGVESPINYGRGISYGFMDRQELTSINAQNESNIAQLDNLINMYKSGRITSNAYKTNLNELNQNSRNLSQAATSIDNRVKLDQANTVQATIDTSAALVTILTAGFGKAAAVSISKDGAIPLELHGAADWLASKGVDVTFKPVENMLNKIAIDGQTFTRLTPEVQHAVQKATAEVLTNTTSAMTAGQIARASAVNLAIKYPIYFNYLSGTSEQVYHDMATGKSGDALKTIGFNAALLLSGGPIGYALKWGGKVASSATVAMFGKTSYFDELAKFYGKDAVDIVAGKAGKGTGDFRTAVDQIKAAVDNPGANQDFIKSLSPASQAHLATFTSDTFHELVKNLSASEATNMASIGGRDAIAAAYRTAQGMVNQRGFNDLKDISHAEGLLDMSRMSSNQRIADEIGKSTGVGPLTVGVIDNRTVGALAKSNVIEGRSVAERNANWEAWKKSNSSYAPANNPNFDRQMYNINKIKSLEARQQAVRDINASKSVFTPKGLTAEQMAQVKQMSKEGFVIIKPTNIEAPFVEGTGKIRSVFSGAGVDRISIPSEGTAKVGAALPNSSLLEQHPYLKDVNIRYGGKGIRTNADGTVIHTKGAYVPSTNTVVVAKGLTREQEVVAIRHELQHVIQQKEGRFLGQETSKLTRAEYLAHPAEAEAKLSEGTAVTDLAKQEGSTDEFFVRASKPLPVLGHIGGVITAMGLSPEASQQRVYQVLNENFAKNLEGLPVAQKLIDRLSNDGEKKMTGNVTDYILKKIQETKTKMPIRDYRMYNSKQIREALNITNSEAVDIQNSIAKSFIQTPMSIRSLGDRVVDLTYATRPTRAVVARFSKAQQALRFAWNPFFTMGRLPFKTEILAQAEGGGGARMFFTGNWGEVGKIKDYLRASGHLEEHGNFNVLSGEAVDIAGQVGSLGRSVTPLKEVGTGTEGEVKANLGKKLTPLQEDSIAGLIHAQATRMGTDWKTYVDQDPSAVRDTIQMIAEYDKKSDFLNSPLARTLNVAFFPFRFEAKVATIFARNLAKTDLMTQVAVVNGLMKANTWLRSTEGQQWYSQNSQAIGLFKYLTPIASLNEIMQSLLPGEDHHLGNFGELGGLPFGWIPQLTDAEGWTHFNAPGVDAKTGDPFPKYIPADQKAQASLAIQDLIGALYSYPGATVGLPSKSGVNRKIGNALTMSSTKDYTKLTTPIDLSQHSKDYAQTIQGASSSTATQVAQQAPQPATPGLPVPPSAPPTPLPRKVAGASGAKKKKKADFTPALLPGQTTLGQL